MMSFPFSPDVESTVESIPCYLFLLAKLRMIGCLGLFTRREGYPCARDTLASGLKLDLVYKQILPVGLPYHLGQLYQL